MKNIFAFLIVLIAFQSAFSQTPETNPNALNTAKKSRGKFYAMFGYTRCAYSKSTIHFVDKSNKYYPETGRYHDYDFTVYDAKASDRPDFNKIPDIINITIPQFVVRGGYYFNNKKDIGIEINYDHAKYVVDDFQTLRIKGTINGTYIDKDTLIDPSKLFHFEHTDGANFWMVNFLKRVKIYNPSKRLHVGLVAKPGIGIVYPRTDVTMLGSHLNNKWHIAGWIVGAEAGLRVEFLRYGVFEFMGKGSYADYRKCLVLGKGNGKANHHFFTAQLTMTFGVMF